MRKMRFPLLAVILGLAAVAVACGDDGGDSGGTDRTAATAAATSTVAPAATSAAAPVGQAAASAAVKAADNPGLGKILTDAQGRTLYIFKRDQPGTSNCYDQCAQTWPPLTISGTPRGEGAPGQLGVADRRDGTKQVTYDGMPLYYFASDGATGDAKGQGVGGVWFVIEMKEGGAGGAAAAPSSTDY